MTGHTLHAPTFAAIPTPVLQAGLSFAALGLYAQIQSFANPRTGEGAYPSLATLAELGGVSKSTVKRYLKELAEAGVLEKRARYHDDRQTTNTYILYATPQVTYERGGEVIYERGGGCIYDLPELDPEELDPKRTLVAEPLEAPQAEKHTTQTDNPTPRADNPTPPTEEPTDSAPCECDGPVNPETGRKRDLCWDAIAEAYKFPPGASGRIAVLKSYFFHTGKSRGEYAKYPLPTPMSLEEFKRWARHERKELGDNMTKSPLKLQERVASWRSRQQRGQDMTLAPTTETASPVTNDDDRDKLLLLRMQLKFAGPDTQGEIEREIAEIEERLA